MWWPAFKVAFSDSLFWCPPPLCVTPSHRVSGLVSMSNEHSRSDGVWLARLAHKRHYSFCLAFFWITHSEESWLSHCEDPQSPRGEVCMRRNRGLQPQPASTKLPALKMTLLRHGASIPQSNLQMPVALADIMTAASQETQSQNHPNSWPTNIAWDGKLFKNCFQPLSFFDHLLHSNRSLIYFGNINGSFSLSIANQ